MGAIETFERYDQPGDGVIKLGTQRHPGTKAASRGAGLIVIKVIPRASSQQDRLVIVINRAGVGPVHTQTEKRMGPINNGVISLKSLQ